MPQVPHIEGVGARRIPNIGNGKTVPAHSVDRLQQHPDLKSMQRPRFQLSQAAIIIFLHRVSTDLADSARSRESRRPTHLGPVLVAQLGCSTTPSDERPQWDLRRRTQEVLEPSGPHSWQSPPGSPVGDRFRSEQSLDSGHSHGVDRLLGAPTDMGCNERSHVLDKSAILGRLLAQNI